MRATSTYTPSTGCSHAMARPAGYVPQGPDFYFDPGLFPQRPAALAAVAQPRELVPSCSLPMERPVVDAVPRTLRIIRHPEAAERRVAEIRTDRIRRRDAPQAHVA